MKTIFNPSKIICVGLNYKKHAEELGFDIPRVPILFLKPPSSIIFNNDAIIIPEMSHRVDYEAELAIVIKDKCNNVPIDEVYGHVEGFTCLNDVTARDLQKIDGQWTRAKSFDTFCPAGPVIAMPDNPDDLSIRCRLNGEIKQDSRTNDLIFDIKYLVSFVSKIMTLEKGDLIATGTPSGVGPMKDGDIVEVEIEGIGILKNFIKSSD